MDALYQEGIRAFKEKRRPLLRGNRTCSFVRRIEEYAPRPHTSASTHARGATHVRINLKSGHFANCVRDFENLALPLRPLLLR
jgi:hypothetical protein